MKKELPKEVLEALEEFDEAAQTYGWSSEQGSLDDAEHDSEVLFRAEEALVRAILNAIRSAERKRAPRL